MGNPGRDPRERILYDLHENLNLLWEATPKGEPCFVNSMRWLLDELEKLSAGEETDSDWGGTLYEPTDSSGQDSEQKEKDADWGWSYKLVLD